MKSYPKYILMTSGWFVLMYIVFTGFAYKADFKVGYMFTDKIWSEYSVALDAQKKIDTEQKELEQQLVSKQTDFDAMVKDFDSKQLMYSDAKKNEIMQTLETMRTEILTFQQQNFDPNSGVLAKKWADLVSPIVISVQAVIDKYGSEQGYDLILESTDASRTILYAKEEYDITNAILEELKKQQPR